MSRTAPSAHGSSLARYDGVELYVAPAAILKGLLEADPGVALVAAAEAEPFGGLLALAREASAAELLRKHEIRVLGTADAARAVTLAHQAARSGRGAFALVPNDDLPRALAALARATGDALPGGGALGVLLEDAPAAMPACCPKRTARQLDLPVLEVATVDELREAMDLVPRLSRATDGAVGVIAHTAVLRSAATLAARPNRVIESVDAMLARRRTRRRPRAAESGSMLRVVRRLELNRSTSLPSPGERVAVGFITVGPAAVALRHLVYALHLGGRVPQLQLSVVHPIDETAIGRLLSRCEQVVVLESRPGTTEETVLGVAEAMRRRGERPGAVWGRALPPDEEGAAAALDADDAIHPSRLARRALHLLHAIRPSGRVAAQLVPDPDERPPDPGPRGAGVGAAAAIAVVRRVLGDVDQWLHDRDVEQEQEEDESAAPATALAIDGVRPATGPERIVAVEVWTSSTFRRDGAAAVRQAARDDRPALLVICAGASDGGDLERLARGMVPGDGAARVRVEGVDFTDRARLVEVLRAAALRDAVTVLVATDGPPPRYEVAALERALDRIDRLGFEPRQHLVRPVDRLGAMRRADDAGHVESPGEGDVPLMRPGVRLDRLRGRHARVVLRVRPMFEQVEVIRTRPPARRWGRDGSGRLPLPEVIHRKAAIWRAHVAGWRGAAPGILPRILADAGRGMGYDVRLLHDPTPIGPGRRAWTQVLFTHPREHEAPLPVATRVPYGEADLLLGLDPTEALRALGPDLALRVASAERTFTAVNVGHFQDEPETEPSRAAREALVQALRGATRGHPRIVEDFAGACRTWFHTDRVTDVALLGAAFQAGLVPLALDALEQAVGAAESAGAARALDAFRFGRRLRVDERLFSRPRDEREEDPVRTLRRTIRLLHRQWPRGPEQARRVRALSERELEAMPGLAETDAGRQAQRDFVTALGRCWIWGGVPYVERFAALVRALYEIDRGETGRALTRHAVLPLATAMLIRDPIFLAGMATSAEQRRWVRQEMNVKLAREDEIRRRYLTRIELVVGGRRLRLDVRTSDWPARLAAGLRRVIPLSWRATRRERELRAYVCDLVERAATAGPGAYEHYARAFTRLHRQAEDGRLPGMVPAELRLLAEPDGENVETSKRRKVETRP